jgi:hypothetical protein
VAPGSSCAVGVRFAPEGKGARTASLAIAGNAATGTVALSGTGGDLPKGDKGDTGPKGATGAMGPRGRTGKSGRNASVHCRRRGHHHPHRVVCIVHYAKVKKASVGGQLARHGVVYATGHGSAGSPLQLTPIRRVRPGSYRLTLVTRQGRHSTVERSTIRIR